MYHGRRGFQLWLFSNRQISIITYAEDSRVQLVKDFDCSDHLWHGLLVGFISLEGQTERLSHVGTLKGWPDTSSKISKFQLYNYTSDNHMINGSRIASIHSSNFEYSRFKIELLILKSLDI